MIKGVNKQILEVTNTESPYFEKIIFFVRPEAQNKNPDTLQKEARKLSLSVKKPPKTKMTVKQLSKTLSQIALGLGAGATLTFILNNFIA